MCVLYNGGNIPDICGAEKTLKLPYSSKLEEVYEQALGSFIDMDLVITGDVRLIRCCDAAFTMKRALTSEELQKVFWFDDEMFGFEICH